MKVKSHKNQITWYNNKCTVTLLLSPCLEKWLVTTTCKFMKEEYTCLSEAAADFEAGTSKSEGVEEKEAAA